jgi:hypothetical protein
LNVVSANDSPSNLVLIVKTSTMTSIPSITMRLMEISFRNGLSAITSNALVLQIQCRQRTSIDRLGFRKRHSSIRSNRVVVKTKCGRCHIGLQSFCNVIGREIRERRSSVKAMLVVQQENSIRGRRACRRSRATLAVTPTILPTLAPHSLRKHHQHEISLRMDHSRQCRSRLLPQ